MRTGLPISRDKSLELCHRHLPRPVGAYRNAAIGSEAAQRNSGAVKDLNRELPPPALAYTTRCLPLKRIFVVVIDAPPAQASSEANPSRRSVASPVLPPAYISAPRAGETPDQAPK